MSTILLLLAACGGEPGTPTEPSPTTPTPTPPTPTPTPSPDCATLSITEAEGVQVLERRLTVTVDEADDVWVVCTSPDDPLEQHLLESDGASTAHDLVLRGLLADTSYACEARPACGGAGATASFATGVPEGPPQLTATRNPAAEMSGAYTLFDSQRGCAGDTVWALIADPEGRLRWMYPVGEDLEVDVDLTLIDPQTIHLGGGWGLFDQGKPNRGVFRTIDLSGRPLIERALPDYGEGFNHHSEPLPDGAYLSLTGWPDTNGARTWDGIGVEVWDPTAGVTWGWNSQALVDQGLLGPPGLLDFLPPYHANAATLRADALGDALWLSIYGTAELWRIDTATGERTHVFGADGDFELVDPAGSPLPDAEFTWVQHGPDYDGDRVLIYDNGQGRPGGNYSRVVEYELDLANRRAVRLWDWTEPGWYDAIVGDADYLPNGNVLVTQGFSGCFQPFSDQLSELVELTPPDTVVWKLTWPTRDHNVYRAQRYDGCDVFANGRYCPDVAARISELRGG